MVSFDPKVSGVSPDLYKPSQGSSKVKQQTETAGFRLELFQFSSDSRGLTQTDMGNQNALLRFNSLSPEIKQGLVFNGRPISDLSPEEASALISEDGHFGVAKTSARISDFVINGAGDNLDRLKAGREGVVRGFQEAEKAWGGTLPDISYETFEKTLAAIDDRINELGGSVVDLTA